MSSVFSLISKSLSEHATTQIQHDVRKIVRNQDFLDFFNDSSYTFDLIC